MARIQVEDVINYPLEQVYAVQRDKMAQLDSYLPNIESITVESRKEIDGGVELVNVWKAAPSEIPAVARSFVKPEMLQWTDYARWDDASSLCHWRLEIGFLKEQIKTSGTTRFEKLDERRTRVTIDGNLEVNAASIPGVPRLLAGRIGPEVEKFVIKLVTPNLKGVNRGVEQFLASQS